MPFDQTTGLFFEAYGENNLPAMIFLHGGGGGGWMWRRQVEYFKDRYHCLVPDLPEQGESSGVRPFTIDSAADCVAALIRSRISTGKAHVVGLSEGAQVLAALLSRHPEVIERAVCSSAAVRPMPGYRLYTRGMFRATYRCFMAPFRNNDGWIRLNMRYSAGIPEAYFTDFKRSFQGMSESGFVNLMYESTHFTLPGGLERANLPVLVVVGEMEYPAMIQSAKDLVAALPQAQGMMVSLGKDSSLAKEHNWAMTAADLFNETVSAWIEGKPLPTGMKPLI